MSIRTIRVFIASPGDLAVERAAFKQVLEELNAGFGDALDIKFEPLGWEDTLASTGRRSQEVINREIDRCDVLILAMHRRWGQAAPDAQPYTSYTEEEFHRALARWQKKRRGKPQAPEIFVFFKHIDSASMADAGPQLQKVLDFRKSLEESRQVLYHGFANEAEFKAEVDRHLRAFSKGELPKADAPRCRRRRPRRNKPWPAPSVNISWPRQRWLVRRRSLWNSPSGRRRRHWTAAWKRLGRISPRPPTGLST
jgi:hypothetical protein